MKVDEPSMANKKYIKSTSRRSPRNLRCFIRHHHITRATTNSYKLVLHTRVHSLICSFDEARVACVGALPVWRHTRGMRGLRSGVDVSTTAARHLASRLLLLRCGGGSSGGDATGAAAGGAATSLVGIQQQRHPSQPRRQLSSGRVDGKLPGASSSSERWWYRAAAAAARNASTSTTVSSSAPAGAATTTTTGDDTAGVDGGGGVVAASSPQPDATADDASDATPLTLEDVAVASQRECADVLRIFKVVRAIRNRGHFAARLDPLGRCLG